ncbi:MFS transporter [Cohnella sp. JJ-181]|uniref:MFS transporter n=1 Tax=Cohnella rhizoplanae TaxID=2974897 RepID=UPI0022FF6B2B|nr:MFS transporter [Cohnella sp. JJ-181]CAI6034075.1 Multidrug resistance protein Stp [Cohnella sp. JJ-181]
MNAQSRGLLTAVGLGVLLNPLNSSMVSVAITRLQEDYRLDYTVVSWIIFSFYISSAIAQPVMGRASDIFGRRRIFLAGLIVAFAASVLAPLSPSFGWLIAYRILQSIGTSMMVAVGMAIVRIHVTEKQATALSVMSIFLSGAAAVGPFVGGVLVQQWDWHAIFYVNIPFAAASFVMAWRSIPQDEWERSSAGAGGGMTLRKWVVKIDLPGILLFAAGLISLLLGLLSAKSAGHLSAGNIALVLIGLLLLSAFVWLELRAPSPFIPLRTFARYPSMTWVNLEFMLANLLFYSLFFGLPSYLQTVRHVNEFDTGMLMLSLGLCSLIASPIAGRWVDRAGPRPAKLLSAMLMTFGSLWLATLNAHSPVASFCLALTAFGFSNGLNGVAMQADMFNSAPKDMVGIASGLFSTSRYFGTILSSLLIGVVMGDRFSTAGMRTVGLILAAVAVSLVFMSRRRREAGVSQTL